jgi:hypothetical protein
MNMDDVIFLFFVSMVALTIMGLSAASQPTFIIEAPDEQKCQRVIVTRFFGYDVMVDATMCGDQKFNWNGDNLLEEETK